GALGTITRQRGLGEHPRLCDVVAFSGVPTTTLVAAGGAGSAGASKYLAKASGAARNHARRACGEGVG
ncbi:MAG: hypothetical protein ABI846_15615, partial [Rudaea sp.]